MLVRFLTGAVCCLALFFSESDASAQVAPDEIASKPWLDGLPIVEQSLLDPVSAIPEFKAICKQQELPAAGASGPYSEPRYRDWVAAYHRCEWAKVTASVEQDLQGSTPHPFAPVVWAAASYAQGKLVAGWEANVSSNLRAGLGQTPELFRLYQDGDALKAYVFLRSLPQGDLTKDPWSAILADWIMSNATDDPSYEFSSAILEKHPDSFYGWWPNHSTVRTHVAELDRLTGTGGALADHFMAADLRSFVFEGHTGDANLRRVTRDWLAVHPDDGFALRLLANSEAALGNIEQASEAYRQGTSIMPFNVNLREIGNLALLNRVDEAAPIAAADARLTPAPSAEALYNYASRLNTAGFVNQARSLAEQGLRRYPDFRELLNLLAEIETAAKRNGPALEYARRAWQQPGAAWKEAERLLEALRKEGLAQEALSFLAQANERLPAPSAPMIVSAADAAKTVGNEALENELLVKGLETAPNTAPILRRLAKYYLDHKQPKDAVAALQRVLALEAGYRDDYVQLYAAGRAISGSAGVEEALSWAVANTGNSQEARYAAIEHYFANDGKARGLELIAEARSAYPDHFWPLYLHYTKIDDGSSAEMQALVEEIEAAQPRFDLREREWSTRLISVIAVKANNKEFLDKAVALFERDLPEMDANYARLSGADLFEAVGDGSTAFRLTENYLKGRPTDSSAIFSLFKSQSEPASAKRFGHVWNGFTRNRYDADALDNYLRLHSLWGGSSIFSYCVVGWVRRDYPEVYPRLAAWESTATGHFGEDAAYFRRTYSNKAQVEGSMRYIGWYQDRKRKALAGGNFVDIDCDRGVATIVDRDGTIQVRQEDYRTGQVLMAAEGRSWAKYTYGKNGVSGVSTSNGTSLGLEYNELGQVSRIVRAENGVAKDDLAMGYNARSKPTVITVAGKGSLKVTYDGQGEILSVQSEGPDGTSDTSVSLSVTAAFQNLLALIEPKNVGNLITETDAQFQQLAEAVALMESDDAALLPAASRLMQAANRQGYTSGSTLNLVDEVATNILSGRLANAPETEFADFGEAYFQLYRGISPFGLPESRWAVWSKFLELAERRGSTKRVATLLDKVRATPLKPMRDENWSGTAELRNQGFWYRNQLSDILPGVERSGLEFQAAYMRRNGDILIASSAGLLVRHKGVWERRYFSADRGGWVREDSGPIPATSVQVTSFAELPNGSLLVGSNAGVMMVGDSYDRVVSRIGESATGLPGAFVHDLLVEDDAIHVATSKGLATFSIVEDGIGPRSAVTFEGAEIRLVSPGPESSLLVSTSDRVAAVDKSGTKELGQIKANGLAWSGDDNRVLILSGPTISTARYSSQTGFGSIVELTNGRSAQLSEESHGLALVEVGGQTAPAVLGDKGLAFWKGGYFDYLPLPYSSAFPAALTLAGAGGEIVVAGSDGSIYTYEPKAVEIAQTSPAYDLAYDKRDDVVYLADGGTLKVVLPTSRGERPDFHTLAYGNIRLLDIDQAGAVIANDGSDIVRYRVPFAGAGTPESQNTTYSPEQGIGDSELLFRAAPDCPADWQCETGVVGLLAARDGSVWATAGPSLFRWKDGEVKEFNALRDPNLFPANTHWLGNVVELSNGDIVVSSSREGHLRYKGKDLTGQNLVFRGGKFEPFSQGGLMVTSATPVDGVDILGSTSGFLEADGNIVTQFRAANDPSYLALFNTHPNIYFAGEGGQLGEDTWLFPTAAGLVGYQNAQWFYPERLNWQYPHPEQADIGARHTYGVAIDRAGRIYAGTDAGLIVFQPEGGDALEFLVDNNRSDLAFSTAERRKLRREAAALRDGIKGDKPAFALARQALAADEELTKLSAELTSDGVSSAVSGRSVRAGSGGVDRAGQGTSESAIEVLGLQLVEKEKEYKRMLAVLEREQPGLAQLITIKPLELTALQRQIPADAVVVQYIPQDSKLMLHVISREKHEIKFVEAPREQLMAAAMAANSFLEASAAEVEDSIANQSSIFSNSQTAKLAEDTPDGVLKLLYDVLLAPIESDIADYKRVYVSAAGELNYVPFSALIRERGGERQFAVQRYTMAMIPTSYLLSLVLGDTAQSASETVIFGDPDGSLEFARKEARKVGELISARASNVVLRIGDEATVPELETHGKNARLLHFATHGVLNPAQPEQSYLLMADQRRLSVIDVMTMELSNAELAFLSACETARGADGIEYATLARAFAHAGVPTIIASLWPVGDEATFNLVEHFYRLHENDSMVALAEAQRAMLSSPGPLRHPAAWSAFQAYGRGWSGN